MNPEQLTLFDPDLYLADPIEKKTEEATNAAFVVVHLDNLGGVTEVAEVLGCAKQQIAALRKRDDFPKPVLMLAATPVWTLSSIRTFQSTWKRRGPRKPAIQAVPAEVVVSED